MTQLTGASFWLGPEQTERACLLIHGFSGTPTEMRSLGEALAANGIRVYVMQVVGHSKDPEDLLRYRMHDWIASTEEALKLLNHYRYIFVAGLSMGGVLSLLLASRYGDQLAGVVALSTPTRFTGGWQAKAVPIARYFIKWFYPLKYLDFTNPKVQAEVLKEAQLRDPTVSIDFANAEVVAAIKERVRIPVPAIAELFTLTNEMRRQIKKIRTPLLIVQSKRDQTVKPACAEELYRLASSARRKELYWLEASDHVITTGPEQAKVNEAVLTFINSIAPGAAAPALHVDDLRAETDETDLDR